MSRQLIDVDLARQVIFFLLAIAAIFADTGVAQEQDTYRAEVFVRRMPNPDVHLYFFTNDGCAPCRQVEPGIEALIREGFPVSVVKVSEQPRVADRFGVQRTPTVIMIANKKMVGRHVGLIDGVTLKKWFAAVGMPNGSKFQPADSSSRTDNRRNERSGSKSPVNTKVVFDRVVKGAEKASIPPGFSTPTMHRGTRRPASEAEQRAMKATVRLKLEDTRSISYATGTVIHSHGNESLVMTCGHVFRENGGKGVVMTAEYDFYGDPQRVPAKLVHYDAGPRDVALVAIRTSTPIQPVRLATVSKTINPGLDVFSIGCDRGDDPTIRHTKIKAKAAYDASPKYDIFGRPVDGRSGGGLFTTDGQLIGVCNSQAVEVDEGIYTAISTLHWELSHTGLAHLFPEDQSMVAMTSNVQDQVRPRDRFADSRYAEPGFRAGLATPNGSGQRTYTSNQSKLHDAPRRPMGPPPQPDDDTEVLILVRSKSNPSATKTISIKDPTPKLIQYLDTMRE